MSTHTLTESHQLKHHLILKLSETRSYGSQRITRRRRAVVVGWCMISFFGLEEGGIDTGGARGAMAWHVLMVSGWSPNTNRSSVGRQLLFAPKGGPIVLEGPHPVIVHWLITVGMTISIKLPPLKHWFCHLFGVVEDILSNCHMQPYLEDIWQLDIYL